MWFNIFVQEVALVYSHNFFKTRIAWIGVLNHMRTLNITPDEV